MRNGMTVGLPSPQRSRHRGCRPRPAPATVAEGRPAPSQTVPAQAGNAGLAGVTEDYPSQIERGLKTPPTTLLHRLARVPGVPTSVARFSEMRHVTL